MAAARSKTQFALADPATGLFWTGNTPAKFGLRKGWFATRKGAMGAYGRYLTYEMGLKTQKRPFILTLHEYDRKSGSPIGSTTVTPRDVPSYALKGMIRHTTKGGRERELILHLTEIGSFENAVALLRFYFADIRHVKRDVPNLGNVGAWFAVDSYAAVLVAKSLFKVHEVIDLDDLRRRIDERLASVSP